MGKETLQMVAVDFLLLLFKLFIGLLQFYGTLRYIMVHYGTRLFPGGEKKIDVKNT